MDAVPGALTGPVRPRVFGGMTMTDQEVQFAYILLVGLLLVGLLVRGPHD